jgi:hypothetical protein
MEGDVVWASEGGVISISDEGAEGWRGWRGVLVGPTEGRERGLVL